MYTTNKINPRTEFCGDTFLCAEELDHHELKIADSSGKTVQFIGKPRSSLYKNMVHYGQHIIYSIKLIDMEKIYVDV